MKTFPGAGMFLFVVMVALLGTLALRGIQTRAQSGLPTPEGPPTETPRGQFGAAVALPTRTPIGTVRTPTPRFNLAPNASECDVAPRSVEELLAVTSGSTAAPSPTQASQQLQDSDTSAVSLGAAPTAAASTVTVSGGVQPTPSGGSSAPVLITPTPAQTPQDVPASSVVRDIQATVRELVACSNAGRELNVWALVSDSFVRGVAAEQGALFNATVLSARARTQPQRQDPVPGISNVRSIENGRVSGRIRLPVNSPAADVIGASGPATVIFVQERGRWVIDEVIEDAASTGS